MSVKGSKDINKFSILELKILNNLFVNHPSSHRLRTKKLISSCLLSLRQRTGRKNPKAVLGAGWRWWLGLGGVAVWSGPGLALPAVWAAAWSLGGHVLGRGGGWSLAGQGGNGVAAVARRLHGADLGWPWRLRGGGFMVIGWACGGQRRRLGLGPHIRSLILVSLGVSSNKVCLTMFI
jgi:hypothetical protein